MDMKSSSAPLPVAAPLDPAAPLAPPFVSLVADPRRRVVVFVLLLTALFMATLDNQIVSTALPTIVGEFGELERFGWIGSAYLLASSAVMPLYGKLGDLFGRKYVIMAAVAIFTLGSLVCGLAISMDTLIARVEEWKAEGKNREVLTVTQPADGIYLLLRQLREGSPLAKETLGLLQWNGGGANSSGRGIANIDTQGAVHPDQFWQSVTLGNVKSDRFSDLWDARAGAAAEMLPELRGSDDPLERQKKIEGRCGRCVHFALCGGGFRTRAAFANGHWYGSDPGCYLTEEEISTPLPEIK